MKQKVKRIMDKYELMEEEAVDKINRHDRTRKRYHDTYSEMVWGDARGYDLCLNSSKLGIDGAVSLIKDYIELRIKFEQALVPRLSSFASGQKSIQCGCFFDIRKTG